MVKCSRKSVKVSDLWVLSNEKLSDFYLSSWQRGESPVPMLVIRLLLAAGATAILTWSLYCGASPYWLIFLTNWGVLMVFIMTFSGLNVSLFAICKKLPDVADGDLPWYISLYWLMYNIAVTISFMITGLYWVLLYDPEQDDESGHGFWLDLTTHGFNSCIVFCEFILSRTPLRFVHIYQPMAIGLWFAIFSGIYYAAGGTDSLGNPFIYEILDWREPTRSLTLIAASVAALIILFTLLWGLTLCRDKISVAVIRTTSLDLPFTPPDRLSETV
ncbi:protein rolling stone-like [Colias croceus]|uniref:protein rolling stone-like n=1 Tax=Colias crocea TaxID=72248 RepID=UPI001E27E2D5|nr:protein rolling stone-like [Colias croceus]